MLVLDVIHSAVVFLTNLSSCQIFVAHVPQNLSEGCLTFLLLLLLADFGVPKLADVSGRFLLVALLLLLLLLAALGARARHSPLSLPVCPDMGQLVSRQEGLVILPVKGVSVENIIHKLC